MAIKLTIYGLDWPKLVAKMSRILQHLSHGTSEDLIQYECCFSSLYVNARNKTKYSTGRCKTSLFFHYYTLPFNARFNEAKLLSAHLSSKSFFVVKYFSYVANMQSLAVSLKQTLRLLKCRQSSMPTIACVAWFRS